MSDLILLFLGTAIVLLVLVYMLYRDAQMSKKLKGYEFALEELNRQIYLLEKNQKKLLNETTTDIGGEMRGYVQGELNRVATDLVESIHEMKASYEYKIDGVLTRVERLEGRTKEYLSMPSNAALDEDRVISLHKAGYGVDEIAKELRANVSEVSFILKINTLS